MSISRSPKIVFFGSSDLSAKVLRALVDEFVVPLVITQPDKPVGRKKVLTPTPVAVAAQELGLGVFKPAKLRGNDVVTKIRAVDPNLFVVVAYGKIIPQKILDLAKHGAVNIHGSLLPKYRGASPIQTALLNGEIETGVSFMLMDAEMDHGPVLKMLKVAVEPGDNYVTLEAKLADLAAQNINSTVSEYLEGALKPVEQNHSEATFTKILTKEDGLVDWNQTSQEIYNQYRAYSKWPGIWCKYKGKVLKLVEIEIGPTNEGVAGDFFDQQGMLYARTSDGSILIKKLQPEAKQIMSGADFIRGRNLIQ